MAIYELIRSCPAHSCVDICTLPVSLQWELQESGGPAFLPHPRILSWNGAWPSEKCVDVLTEWRGKHCDRSKDRCPRTQSMLRWIQNEERGSLALALSRVWRYGSICQVAGCSAQGPSRHKSVKVGDLQHCREGRGVRGSRLLGGAGLEYRWPQRSQGMILSTRRARGT